MLPGKVRLPGISLSPTVLFVISSACSSLHPRSYAPRCKQNMPHLLFPHGKRSPRQTLFVLRFSPLSLPLPGGMRLLKLPVLVEETRRLLLVVHLLLALSKMQKQAILRLRRVVHLLMNQSNRSLTSCIGRRRIKRIEAIGVDHYEGQPRRQKALHQVHMRNIVNTRKIGADLNGDKEAREMN